MWCLPALAGLPLPPPAPERSSLPGVGVWITFDLPVDKSVHNFIYRRLLQVLCYNITSGCMGYLWISQGIWSILEHLCYTITPRLLDTLDSLWITLGYLWINRGIGGR